MFFKYEVKTAKLLQNKEKTVKLRQIQPKTEKQQKKKENLQNHVKI